jgi:hypothetical protein
VRNLNPAYNYLFHKLGQVAEVEMEQKDRTGEVTASIEEIAIYNMLLSGALYELLADKEVVTRAEIG